MKLILALSLIALGAGCASPTTNRAPVPGHHANFVVLQRDSVYTMLIMDTETGEVWFSPGEHKPWQLARPAVPMMRP